MLASHNVYWATGDWVAVKILPQPNAKKIHVPIMYIAHITKIERGDDKYTVSFVTLKASGQPGVYVWPAKEDWSCCSRSELVKIGGAPFEEVISAHSDAARMKFTLSHSDIDYARRCLGVAMTTHGVA